MFYTTSLQGDEIRTTNFCNLQRNVVTRITTHLKHCHTTKFRCCKLNWRLLFSTNLFNLQQQNFVAWQCLRLVVIRATTLFNLQRANVTLQVGEKCCPYYRAMTTIYTYSTPYRFCRETLDWCSPNDRTLRIDDTSSSASAYRNIGKPKVCCSRLQLFEVQLWSLSLSWLSY